MTEKNEIMKQLLENTQAQGSISAKPILLPKIRRTSPHSFDDIMGAQSMMGDPRAVNTEIASKISDILDLVKEKSKEDQKDLIEDSVIIHRISTAPERKVFHIDTGGLPDEEALKKIDELKDAMIQKCAETRIKNDQ